MRSSHILLSLIATAALTASATGQQSRNAAARNNPAPQRARPVNPAFRQIQEDPSLPNVLLIGDSISIAYTLPLREELKGKANVHRPPTNCGPTITGLKQIDAWLGDTRWDLIHFNFGLHDLKYLGPRGQNLANPKDPGSRQQVPPEQYEENLRKLVARLKQTNAILIWRSTTPVPQGARGRVVGDAAKYNEIAARVMAENKIPIDDMYGFALPRLAEIQRKADVHFTPAGSKALARHSAEIITAALKQRPSTTKDRPGK